MGTADTPPGPAASERGGDPVETPELRHAACCAAEPECPLCPLRPENAGRSLRSLRDEGLRANLVRLGFR